MMHKQEKIESIINAYTKRVKPMLIVAEIGEFDIKPSEETNHAKLDMVIKWLDEFIKNEVTELEKVWVLCPPHVWANYKMYKLTDLVEMKMLKIAKRDFKEAWVKRPSAIRRTYGSSEV